MNLFFDSRDDRVHEQLGSELLYWLDDLDAKPLGDATAGSTGFVFAGNRGTDDYRRLMEPHPLLRDRPSEREPLLRLDSVLERIAGGPMAIPSPRTWAIPLDGPLPAGVTYPLFVRTAETSLKLGGRVSRVRNERELVAEACELRRVLGWNAVILAREWLDLAPAGFASRGPVPQEVRVWVVDGEPFAWSFHHLHLVPRPEGLPLDDFDARTLRRLAGAVGGGFQSRLVAADFAKSMAGEWWFIEAGPGSCAGTAHEGVFKAVAARLVGRSFELTPTTYGGTLPAG